MSDEQAESDLVSWLRNPTIEKMDGTESPVTMIYVGEHGESPANFGTPVAELTETATQAETWQRAVMESLWSQIVSTGEARQVMFFGYAERVTQADLYGELSADETLQTMLHTSILDGVEWIIHGCDSWLAMGSTADEARRQGEAGQTSVLLVSRAEMDRPDGVLTRRYDIADDGSPVPHVTCELVGSNVAGSTMAAIRAALNIGNARGPVARKL